MLRAYGRLIYRVVSLLIGIFAFSQAICADINFGLGSGLICGSVAFLFTLFVVCKNSTMSEEIFLPTSPCWPAAKYPQSYWFSAGLVVFISAFVNFIFHMNNTSAAKLYLGLSIFGFGMFAGAVVAHYQLKKRSL
jgi:hypothetical protein